MDSILAAPLADALGGNLRRAVTIVRHRALSPRIKDATYEYASPAAADLWGLAPSEFLGAYMSFLHPPYDLIANNLIALARMLGCPKIPSQYASRIRRKDGTDIWVEKRTTPLIGRDGGRYWVTTLKQVPSGELPTLHLAAWKIPLAMLREWFGIANMFMADHALGKLTLRSPLDWAGIQIPDEWDDALWKEEQVIRKRHNAEPLEEKPDRANFLTNYQTDTMISQTVNKASRNSTQEQPMAIQQLEIPSLRPGGTVRLPDSLKRPLKLPFMHLCADCHEVFNSRMEVPKTCGKCKSPLWRGDYIKDVRRRKRKAS